MRRIDDEHPAQRLELLAGVGMVGMMAMAAVQIAVDQVEILPPRPPTPAERAAAYPKALAAWRIALPRLAARVPAYDGFPLEFGKVWATRTGQLCGLINDREAGVDRMEPFYTVKTRLLLRDDDLLGYFRAWRRCAQDEWVILHPGTTYTGLCASPRARKTWFGRDRCGAWLARSRPVAP
jgi:hypothetical protein